MSEPKKKYELVACGESCGRVVVELTETEFQIVDRVISAYESIKHESYSPNIRIDEWRDN